VISAFRISNVRSSIPRWLCDEPHWRAILPEVAVTVGLDLAKNASQDHGQMDGATYSGPEVAEDRVLAFFSEL
jgi:hypothetical protein